MGEFLKWSSEFKIGDVIALLGFAATVGGVIYAGLQVKQNAVQVKQNALEVERGTLATRADILIRLFENYFGNDRLREIYYQIDYNKFKFDEQKFQLGEGEPYVDRLIYFFDTVGWLVKKGVLTMDEVSLIAYQAQRVLYNREILAYLAWLDKEYERDHRPTPAHREARELAQTISTSR